MLAASVSTTLIQILLVEQETPAKENVTSNKDIISEKVPSNTQVFNSNFVDDLIYVQSNSDLN